MVFKILKLRNNVLIKFLSENLLIFLCTYQKVAYSDHLEKEFVILQRRIKYRDNCKSNLIFLVENKKLSKDSVSIYSDPGYAKADKTRKN